MVDYSISNVIAKIKDGNIRIPAFQRGFVWEAEEISYFMDSLYKGFPFGIIQFWRTKEPLKCEKKFGPFELFERDPQYPIDYVIDGQQRLTSIFGVFQTDISPSLNCDNPFKVYFDYTSQSTMQECQFVVITEDNYDKNKYFPLHVLFDPKKFRQATDGLSDDAVAAVDKLQSIFKEVRVPFQTLETDNKSKVAIVFERINRKGLPLDTFQLLSAWTWNDDFALQDKINELKEELEPFGFNEIGENVNLLLKIISAIITNNASAESLMEINGESVRNKFDEITNGIKGSIDFLRQQFKIEKINNLPYDNLLVPLSKFFSVKGNQHYVYSDEQRQTIVRWFWKTCFSKRYSAGTISKINEDIQEIIKLKCNMPNKLGNFACDIDESFFWVNDFSLGSVNTKTFILLLVQNNPKSFISGTCIDLSKVLKDYNRNEFHHIFPKAYLNSLDEHERTFEIQCLANFCFISRADNNKLGGVSPSKYKNNLPLDCTEILSSAYCSEDIFNDDYNDFIMTRSKILLKSAENLINH